ASGSIGLYKLGANRGTNRIRSRRQQFLVFGSGASWAGRKQPWLVSGPYAGPVAWLPSGLQRSFVAARKPLLSLVVGAPGRVGQAFIIRAKLPSSAAVFAGSGTSWGASEPAHSPEP